MSQVKIIRLTVAGDSSPLEMYQGTLVNQAGEPIEALTIGNSIYLHTGEKRRKKVPWTFRTAPIIELQIFDPGHWEVLTNDGQSYSIDPDRVYH